MQNQEVMENKAKAAITAVSGYVPEKILSNKDLEKLVEHWKDHPEVADMFANTVSSPNVFETVGEIIKLNRIQENRDMTFEQAFPETVHVYNNASKHKNNPYLG